MTRAAAETDDALLARHGYAVRLDGRVWDPLAACWVNPAPLLARLRDGREGAPREEVR